MDRLCSDRRSAIQSQSAPIKKLVETLNQILDFNYEFDLTKPSGAQKRIMDITKAKQEFDFNTKTDLKNGLEETIEWYKNNKSDHLKKQNYFNNG